VDACTQVGSIRSEIAIARLDWNSGRMGVPFLQHYEGKSATVNLKIRFGEHVKLNKFSENA
jgi:hypothetical protein